MNLLVALAISQDIIIQRQYIQDRLKRTENLKVIQQVQNTVEHYNDMAFYYSGLSPIANITPEQLVQNITGVNLANLLYTQTYRTTFLISTPDYYKKYNDFKEVVSLLTEKGVLKTEQKLDEEYARHRTLYVLGKYMLAMYDFPDYDVYKYALYTDIPAWCRSEIGLLIDNGIVARETVSIPNITTSEVISMLVTMQQKVYDQRIEVKYE